MLPHVKGNGHDDSIDDEDVGIEVMMQNSRWVGQTWESRLASDMQLSTECHAKS